MAHEAPPVEKEERTSAKKADNPPFKELLVAPILLVITIVMSWLILMF